MINASEYARALFLLTEENETTDKVLADLRIAKQVISENPRYSSLADTPALPKEEKLALIGEAFAPLDRDLVSLLKILVEKHSVALFPRIADEYFSLYDNSRGIERVVAVSAVAMTEEQILGVKKRLEEQTGKTVIVENKIEPEILGGIKLRYSGIQLDGSLKTRLDALDKSLKSLII